MDMVGRLSGDEFVVWYNGVTKQEANASILRLKTSIKEESIARDAHNINFSVGVVTIKPNTLLNIEEIINAADVLMYKDKLIR
jgi:diguanylate cyclase (GGDEF)-like protein